MAWRRAICIRESAPTSSRAIESETDSLNDHDRGTDGCGGFGPPWACTAGGRGMQIGRIRRGIRPGSIQLGKVGEIGVLEGLRLKRE